jgi:hypothetical protein
MRLAGLYIPPEARISPILYMSTLDELKAAEKRLESELKRLDSELKEVKANIKLAEQKLAPKSHSQAMVKRCKDAKQAIDAINTEHEREARNYNTSNPHHVRNRDNPRPQAMHECVNMNCIEHVMIVVSVENASTPVVRHICANRNIPFLPLESGDFTSNLQGDNAWMNCYLGIVRGAIMLAKYSCPCLKRVTLVGIVPTWAHKDVPVNNAKHEYVPAKPSFAVDEQRDLRTALHTHGRDGGVFAKLDRDFAGTMQQNKLGKVEDFNVQLLYLDVKQFDQMMGKGAPAVYEGFDKSTGLAGGVSSSCAVWHALCSVACSAPPACCCNHLTAVVLLVHHHNHPVLPSCQVPFKKYDLTTGLLDSNQLDISSEWVGIRKSPPFYF